MCAQGLGEATLELTSVTVRGKAFWGDRVRLWAGQAGERSAGLIRCHRRKGGARAGRVSLQQEGLSTQPPAWKPVPLDSKTGPRTCQCDKAVICSEDEGAEVMEVISHVTQPVELRSQGYGAPLPALTGGPGARGSNLGVPACLCLVRHGLRPGHVAWAVMPRVPGRSRKVLDPSSQRESMGGSAEYQRRPASLQVPSRKASLQLPHPTQPGP